MALETTVSDIVSRLREGRIQNEQAISQGVVLRILQELGWNTWDTNLVWPEFRTGEGRADFALCHPPTRPAVFIEVKPVGRAEDAVRQALDYAFHTGGVPFVILTDGQTWSFYLTMERGTYEERRVYKLDLFERSAAEAAAKFSEYLSHDRVVSGQALAAAREAYRDRNRAAQAKIAIPTAWQELVGSGDETLLDLLASAVESKAGVRPDDDDILTFLTALRKPLPHQAVPPAAPTIQPQAREQPFRLTPIYDAAAPSRRGTLMLDGKPYPYANAKEAMVTVLRELAKRDPTFLQRCSQRADAQGRKRNYIARTPDDLYPDRPDLREYHEELPGGWYVATNLNNVLKKSIIRLAAEVAGLRFGRDVTVEF